MIQLPENKEDLAVVLGQLGTAGDNAASPYRVQWLVNYYWLQGVRDFSLDYSTGQVGVHLYNQRTESGQLDFRFEDILNKKQIEEGRLAQMDIRPSSTRRGFGLSALRDSASSVVILEALTSETDYDSLEAEVNNLLTIYGTAGIAAWERGSKAPGVPPDPTARAHQTEGGSIEMEAAEEGGGTETARGTQLPRPPQVLLEAIPCWQLTSIPAKITAQAELEGVRRKRWVPLDWLKQHKQLDLSVTDEKLGVTEGPYGCKPGGGVASSGSAISESAWQAFQAAGKPAPDRPKTKADITTKYVCLEEFFMLADQKDQLSRWIVKVGKHIALTVSYDKVEYMPIGIARYLDTGGFFGRSLVELLQPTNAEHEQMLQSLFENVKDMDAYGMLFVPQHLGVSKNDILKKGPKRKVVFFDPDYTVPESKPYAIQPATTTDFPGKVAAMCGNLSDRLLNQSELLRGEAPGRVDSASGLGFLHETSSIPLTVPAGSLARAYTQVYKAILGAAPRLLQKHTNLPLLKLDDSLLGLVVNPTTGMVTLNPSNFPTPASVRLGIKDQFPKPPSLRLQELKDSLSAELITHVEFRMTVWKEDLDYPVGAWDQFESYRKAMLQCILLFGDGDTPGQIVSNVEADIIDIHLMVIQMFMSKLEFSFAGKDVREAFEGLKVYYRQLAGQEYPEALPPPEDLGMVPGGPGGPPPGAPPGMAGGAGGGPPEGGPPSGPPPGP